MCISRIWGWPKCELYKEVTLGVWRAARLSAKLPNTTLLQGVPKLCVKRAWRCEAWKCVCGGGEYFIRDIFIGIRKRN